MEDRIQTWISQTRTRLPPSSKPGKGNLRVSVVSVRGFGNLCMLDEWAKESNVDVEASLVRPSLIGLIGSEEPETYKSLSKRQNKTWARKMVIEGIALSQDKLHTDAIAKYTKALEIDPECVDALVARGASYANQGFFEKAIADHKKALVIEPTHQNAHRYLQKCMVRKKELDDEKRSAETGNFLMPLDETPDRRGKILLTKELMYSDGTVEPHPPKNPPPPPHALSALQRNYSTSSLGSSTEAITQKPEEYGFVFDDVEDTVAPPPDSSSSSRKRKKEKKSSKEKKKRKKEKKEKKKSSSKKRRRRDSDSDDSNSDTDSDTE